MGVEVVASEQEQTAGVVLIDKPVGCSSFSMVYKVRKLIGIKKVGHAGTLDPFASGLLIICIGRPATRTIDQFMGGRKSYIATLKLGAETTTQDPEGEITQTCPVPVFEQEQLDQCLKQFSGKQMQAPPPFSAAKHKGKPLYHYARKGVVIKKEPKPIEIFTLSGTLTAPDELSIQVSCTPGTYIRVLGEDIGRALGCGAHLKSLRRTASGAFHVDQALAGDVLAEEDGVSRLQAAMMQVDDALKKSKIHNGVEVEF